MLDTPFSVAEACVVCGKQGKTCCFFKNDTIIDKLLPISKAECENIARFLGVHSIEHLFAKEIVTEAFQAGILSMFPGEEAVVQQVFPLGGERWRCIVRGEIKHCLFLGIQGCILPRHIRPILCRMFPFWVFPSGSVSLFGTCLLVPENLPIEMQLQNAKMSLPELYALYGILRKFWGFEKDMDCDKG